MGKTKPISLWKLIHNSTGMKCTVSEFDVLKHSGLSVRELRQRTGSIPMPCGNWRAERVKGAKS
jgi:hypothetical protein